jgi:nuclear pore complex protein Nup107
MLGTRDYIDELDPDAPIRLRKPLHDLDQEDEYCLMEYLFKLVRAGDLKQLKALCIKTGNTWRAATLEGFNLFNDFNYSHLNGEFEGDDDDTKENGLNRIHFNKGNPNRDLWKFVVSKMIDNDVINVYEKAVYASLAGFIRPILPLCKNYVDYIWVYFKALYNQLLEKELK